MKLTCTGKARKLISNWETLGSALNIAPKYLAHALYSRDSMQHRIRLGKRVVYKSDPLLHFVQNRLSLIAEPLLDELPGNDVVLSYRRGQNPVEEIKKLTGAKLLISTDIKKFYDHVVVPHIAGALMDCGFSKNGAKLIARYCIVKRGEHLHTLQQGCPASPAISNLVGYKYFDRPITKWLKENLNDVEYKYVRYCDNIELFIYGKVPEDFPARYKEEVKKITSEAGFRTHDWATISDSHPKLNQKFLGVVLNSKARVERGMIDELRATLFNLCVKGLSDAEVARYMRSLGKIPLNTEVGSDGAPVDAAVNEMLRGQALRILGGKVAYVRSVNDRHGKWLGKLLALAKDLATDVTFRANVQSIGYHKKWKDSVLKYKDDSQDTEAFLALFDYARY